MVIFYQKSEDKKVGFVASKKVGNAVKRNRAKRRLRAIFRESSLNISNGLYILVAKNSINSKDYHRLLKDFDHSLKKLHRK
jgi:ribonuclease P protein component